MELTLVRADPAGNITLLVEGDCPAASRGSVAARLMAMSTLGAEQVGFVTPPRWGGDGRIEMMGGEFCGNAARSMGLFLARRMGGAARQVAVEISGCEHPVWVWADPANQRASAEMPIPRTFEAVTLETCACMLVTFEGIAHAVVEGQAPDICLLDALETYLAGTYDAFGLMFVRTLGDHVRSITPVVRVPAAGSTVWESSCGSGSVATAALLLRDVHDGAHMLTFAQPGGEIDATIVKKNGHLTEAFIGGSVSLGEPFALHLSDEGNTGMR
ncbi:MAG: hypothetical protein RR135_04625 [Oscillospiraceae bacterium]